MLAIKCSFAKLEEQNTVYPHVMISTKPSWNVWTASSLSALHLLRTDCYHLRSWNSNSENNHAKNLEAKDSEAYFNPF